jgi:hypothetical protein
MLVSVTFLRRFGRRLPLDDGLRTIAGNLRVYARRGMLMAEIRGRGPVTDDPVAVLWDVRVTEIGNTIRLRGCSRND